MVGKHSVCLGIDRWLESTVCVWVLTNGWKAQYVSWHGRQKCPQQLQQSKLAKRGMKLIEEKRFIYSSNSGV